MYVAPDWSKDADEDLEDAGKVARRSHDLVVATREGKAENADALADDARDED